LGRWKRGIGKGGTGKRGTLKVWKALQFSKARATEQRSIKTHRDPRIALVPCGHQRFCEPCANEVERQDRGCPICRTDIQMILRLFLTFTLCCVLWSVTFCIEWLGHFRICFVVRVTINFVYVGNSLVWYRIHCVCNFDRMVCFLLTFDVFWFCAGFLTRSVSVTCIFSCMNLLQHIKYYQFLYVFVTAQQHPFLFYNTGTIGIP